MKNEVSLIHCADVHLDAPFSGLSPGGFSQQRRRELKEVFERIISLVQEKNADYLLISGDLYEHHYVTASTIRWLNDQFRRIADKSVILIPGNHDPYVQNSWYKSFPWASNVHILTTRAPEYEDVEKGVYFYGIGFDAFRQEHLPVMASPSISPDRINICLFHGTVDMAFTQNPYNPIDSNDLLQMGFDYYALGHFHSKNGKLVQGVINPGSPEPLGFDEPGEHGVFWVTLKKEENNLSREATFIQTQKRLYRELKLDTTHMELGRQLQESLQQLAEAHDANNEILKITITGRAPAEYQDDFREAAQSFLRQFPHVQLVDRMEPAYDLDALSEESNLTGVFVRLMREKMLQAGENDRKVLRKALFLGLDAITRGTVEPGMNSPKEL